jgi:thiol:disulfide interchange protein DsbD
MILNLSLFAFNQNEILQPSEAFMVDAQKKGENIETTIKLGEQIYLFDRALKYTIIKPKEVSLDKLLKKPVPTDKDGEKAHLEDVVVNIPLSLIKQFVGDSEFTIKINYQGCSKKGLCYQPLKAFFSFDKDGNRVEVKEEIKEETTKKTWGKPAEIEEKIETNSNLSEEGEIAQKLKNSSFFTILALFFGFGLILALTPCIYPMIPILSSIITLESKQSGGLSWQRGLLLSFVYVVSSAFLYAIAGVLAAVFGVNILSIMQNPWILVSFAVIFVALAFSMFGYYEIQLPKALQNFANKKSEEKKGTGLIGVAIMGALSALIVGPCVAPPLAGALLFIGQTGDVLLGGMALFLLGLGMGAPLLIIGAGGGKFLPKPGGWMTKVSYVFGVVMLGIAITFLSRILPDAISLLLWALLFIGSAIYAGALEPFKDEVKGASKLIKVFAITLLAYGFIVMVGAFTGGNNIFDPLKKLYSTKSVGVVGEKLKFTTVATIDELKDAISKSKKPVLIDFTAVWCVACKELEEITFVDSTVISLMNKFTLLKVDVTDNSSEDKVLQKAYGVVGPPAIIFYDKDKNELKAAKMIGFKPPLEFIPILKKVLGE